MARLGFLSMPWLRHCHPCRASSFFRSFSVLPVVTVFTLMELRNGTFFFSQLPRSWLGGLAFAVLSCFLLVGMVASTCGGIRGGGINRWFIPDSSALGASLPGLLGSCSWSCCLRHVQVVAATAAPSVLHTSCQPGLPREFRLRWCRRWLRLRILSGRSPLCRSLCSVSSSASSPSTLVASWYGG